MLIRRPALLLALASTAVGCSSDSGTEPQEDQLVVRAQSADAPALVGPALAGGGSADPTSFIIGFYRFYIAENADCSSPVLLEDHGATAETHDLLTNPTLFTVSGAPGTYDCIAMRISDVLTFTSGETFGPCVAGTTYTTDTYRDGEDDWLDVDGSPIVGSGEDSAPVDNRVDIFFSTSPPAVLARGYSSNQVLQLIGGVEIPGTTDFVYDATNSVADEGGDCRILPGAYTFR